MARVSDWTKKEESMLKSINFNIHKFRERHTIKKYLKNSLQFVCLILIFVSTNQGMVSGLKTS